MEFKGTNCEWKVNPCIDKNDLGVKFLSIDFVGISHVDCINVYANENQDETNLKANAQLIANSPKLLNELNETVIDLKILRNQIADALKQNHLFEGMPELIDEWIERKTNLINQATKID
jgi:hypothetical protein